MKTLLRWLLKIFGDDLSIEFTAESRKDDPVNPKNGQVWCREDLCQ